jgi:hypothetical protein
MFTRAIGFSVVVSVLALACGGAPSDSSGSDDDAVTSASDEKNVQGVWTLQNDVTSIKAIVLNPDHTFFRANAKPLNGVFINGAGPGFDRETGTWSLSHSKHTITFNTDNGPDVLSYTFTPAHVLNGVFLPGHEPKDKLELRGIPAPGSQIAFPTQEYARGESFCLATSDCDGERTHNFWQPVSADNAKASCNTTTNACEMKSAAKAGELGGMCGGIAGIQCKSGLDCKLTTGPNGQPIPDAGGTCVKSDAGQGNSDCEVEEGGSCVDSEYACTQQGGQVSGNNCDGSATGGTVCCDLP